MGPCDLARDGDRAWPRTGTWPGVGPQPGLARVRDLAWPRIATGPGLGRGPGTVTGTGLEPKADIEIDTDISFAIVDGKLCTGVSFAIVGGKHFALTGKVSNSAK